MQKRQAVLNRLAARSLRSPEDLVFQLVTGYIARPFYLQEMELRVETKETGNGDKYSTYTV